MPAIYLLYRVRLRLFVAVAVLGTLLTGCDGADSAKNRACEQQAHGTLPWGYYPGYGCGPVPPAQTQFSEA